MKMIKNNNNDLIQNKVHAHVFLKSKQWLRPLIGLLPVLLITGLSFQAKAGPSYSIECEDHARNNTIHMFDLNPSSDVMRANGVHHLLPDTMESFVLEGNGSELTVVSYAPYEVELLPTLGTDGQRPAVMIGENDGVRAGILEKVILENESELIIDQEPRKGAITLVLTSGMRLRFNHCDMKGDVSILDWESTFKI